MYRRTMLVVLSAAVLALGGATDVKVRAQEKSTAKGEHHEAMHAAYHKCAKACADCMMECESCARHCAMLLSKGEKAHMVTLAMCADCGDMCALAAKVTSRMGPTSMLTCDACARTCDVCAKACEEYPKDEHMMRCAKACRECAKACREMLKHSGHESKGT